MLNFLVEQYKASQILRYIVWFFVLLSGWWFYMYMFSITEGTGNTLFLLVYPVLPLIGGVYGLIFAKKWGGFRSKFGSAVSILALGFLAQFVGQYLYNYYQVYLGIDVPYPSIGDLFYFASVVLYVIGTYKLADVAGIKLSFRSVRGKVAMVIPFIVLLVSYWVLLQGYEADWANKLVIFLDFGYPIGQAIYLSIALLAFLISKDILGGLMRNPIMLLIVALVVQFLADFSFSYQVSREVITYYPSGTNDYLFAFSYFLMTIALFSIGNMFYKVQKT